MDISYCDRCGEMLPAQGGSPSLEILCANCQGTGSSGGAPSAPAHDESPMSLSGVLQDDGLNLFSNETIQVRRQPQAPSKLQLVEEEPAGASFLNSQPSAWSAPGAGLMTSADAAPMLPNAGHTSTGMPPAPMPPQQGSRLRVDCIHCQAKLALPPVQQRSKLRCPRCSQVLVVEPTGQVSAPRPGSIAVPKENERLAHFDTDSLPPLRQEQAAMGSSMGGSSMGGSNMGASMASSRVQPPMGTPGGGAMAGSQRTGGHPSQGHGGQTRVLAIPQPADQMGTRSPHEPPGKLTLDQALSHPMAASRASEGNVASALLGNPTTTPATATFRRTQAPGSLPTEKLVLWILIAAMPTFAGLLLASDIAGADIDSVVKTIGGSVRECSENFFNWIRTLQP